MGTGNTPDMAHHATFGRCIQIGGDRSIKKYSDNVSINLEGYKAAVLSTLRQISANPVGAAVINALDRRVVIIPAMKDRYYQAFSMPYLGTYNKDGAPLSHPMIDILVFSEESRIRVGWLRAHGGGAPAVIIFTPGHFIKGYILNHDDRGLFTPEGVLIHELVHAVRTTRGVMDTRVFAGRLECWGDIEEFLAILIANIYRSSIGVPFSGLRWQYGEVKPHHKRMADLGGTLRSNHDFYNHYKEAILVLYKQMPGLFGAIAQVRCGFNPIALAKNDIDAVNGDVLKTYKKIIHVFKTNKQLREEAEGS